MHAIAPVPSRNRTHGKSVVFDGGVPALDVPAGARARTRSHRQPATAALASPYGSAELFRIGAEVRFQASISASVESRTRRTISIPHREDDMASRATRFALVFGMAFATALTILAITTWARTPDSQSEWTAPIAPKQPIYRSQLRTVF